MNYRLLYVIASWGLKNQLLKMLEEQGCKKLNIMYGKGMHNKKGEKRNWFSDNCEEKIVITAICKSDYVEGVYRRLNTKFGFTKPNTGFAFSLDVSYEKGKGV